MTQRNLSTADSGSNNTVQVTSSTRTSSSLHHHAPPPLLQPLHVPERTNLPHAELLERNSTAATTSSTTSTQPQQQQQHKEVVQSKSILNTEERQTDEFMKDMMIDEDEISALNLAPEDLPFAECERLLMRAVQLKWEQNYSMAYQITRYCVDTWPHYYHAHFQNGLTLHSMNKPQDAIDNFKQCINCTETINQAYLHISEGWIYFLLEKHDLAEQEFQKAIQADPTCSYAYFSRGYVQDVLKKLDDAIESFDYALKFVPRYSPCGIYNNQAWCYEQKKDHTQDTLKYYTLAIESNPSFVRAYYNRSKVYQEEGKFDEAIVDLEKILGINRTHLYTYLELGDIYWFDKNNKEKALYYYSYAKNIIAPTNVYAYLLIASIYAYDKDFEAANSELNLGMERCYQADFLQELQKKKVSYDENYLEYIEKEAPNKYDEKTLRKTEEIKHRLDRDRYILENKFYENKYRNKMKQRLKAILYIPLSELEIAATPLTIKPSDSMFELSPTRLSPMKAPLDFNYYIYYHYEHWNVGSVLFSDCIIKTRR